MRGAEFDATARLTADLTIYGAVAYTDGIYVSFPDAPPPLEDTGGPQVKDISGSVLPGHLEVGVCVRRRVQLSLHISSGVGPVLRWLDASYRSSFSSSASVSRYLVVAGYPLLNARLGFRWSEGWALFLWSRNVLDQNYFELLTAAPGNTGLYVGQPGDRDGPSG